MTPVERALLDTSVVIELPADLAEVTRTAAISTITLAELAFGLHTHDPVVNAAREQRYRRIEATFDPIAYGVDAARMYGALCANVRAAGRDPRPRRFDLLIASVAATEGLPVVTRNPTDFSGFHSVVVVIAVT